MKRLAPGARVAEAVNLPWDGAEGKEEGGVKGSRPDGARACMGFGGCQHEAASMWKAGAGLTGDCHEGVLDGLLWLCEAGHRETWAVLEIGGGPLCSSPSLFLFIKASQAFPGQGCVQRGPSRHWPHRGHGWGRHKYGQEVLISPVCSLPPGGWTRSEQEKTAWPAGAGSQDRPPSDAVWRPVPRGRRGVC